MAELGISVHDLLTGDLGKEARHRAGGENFGRHTESYNLKVFLALTAFLAASDDESLRQETTVKEASFFTSLIKSPEEVVKLLEKFGLRASISQEKRNGAVFVVFRVDLIQYLHASARFRDESLALRNFNVEAGVVKLTDADIKKLIFYLIKEKIEKIVEEMRGELEGFRITSSKEDAFPPCMVELSNKELNEAQTTILAVFLTNVGRYQEAERLLERWPELQDRMRKAKFIPFSCRRMAELGLCVSDCGTENPLQYYFEPKKRKSSPNRPSIVPDSP
ncbi:DNA primase large subunit [Sulfodiicoccus acidiphilus]|uniref:DNA primase large subunit n=1 Tax=Sulfodiicoccus acidiphilus TaxID=1670455 RepID=A0A348B0S4_9CREN|nr:hypothetical protein [Sulfodiicoccus acidiphilus]BBD71776.1 DNA primase large subunit [Sulfodiicoccus acidiphilus]GGT99136.1 DNA primase large subunit [Sulfodiicoccus acidiphilus]